MRKSSELSRKILFVAIARTFGIPARLNPMDGAMEYLDAGSGKTGSRRLCRQPFPGSDRRKGEGIPSGIYRCRHGMDLWTELVCSTSGEKGYFTLELEELSWENGKLGVEVDPGVYRIITGNRLPNGNVFGKSLTFRVEKGEEKTVEMSFRDAKLKDMLENISILPFNLLDKDGSKVPAADVTRGDRKILFWLEVSKEPTEHILNELMERKEAFENYQREPSFIIKKDEDLKDPTLGRCREALPGNSCAL